MKIAESLFQEIRESGVEQVVTGCASCAMQIAQGTDLPVVHPLVLLAEAYRRGGAPSRF
jgi:Fe-S oxidoreductase